MGAGGADGSVGDICLVISLLMSCCLGLGVSLVHYLLRV